jgi:hypothetical protein
MSDQLMEFSSRVGQESWRLLAQRALDELSDNSDFDRFTALMGAALIPIAEVLREPIEKARDSRSMADQMVAICARQLRGLLEPVIGKDES